MSDYVITTDKGRLDLEFIVRSLQTTYWASQRPREVTLAAIEGSLCFGAYDPATGQQVGFARAVTDGATMAWLCDVFVDPAHRGRGLGKQIMAAVVAHPTLARARLYLATKDAHGLYEQYGFQRFEVMRRERPALAPASNPAT